MNLPNEENSLSLFRYIPDVTSQLLIQSNETQELVPVPSICDDLLLTDLEAGNGWTLGGLPVLLNTPFPTNDQQLSTDVEPSIDFDTDKSQLPDILDDSPVTTNTENDAPQKDNAIYPLEIPSKNFLSEDECLFISSDHLGAQFSETKVDPDVIDVQTVDEIQSSDISSQQALMGINGALMSPFSLIPNNIINSERKNINIAPKPAPKKKRNNTLLKKKSPPKKHSKPDPEPSNKPNLIEILNLDGTTTILNLDGHLFEEKEDTFHTELVEEEPDSTVVSDTDNVNITDIADVVMSFKCKMCEFSCNDRNAILKHHRDAHVKVKNVKKKLKTPEPEIQAPNPQMINLICGNNNLSDLLLSVEETEKKIMRIKRKSKKVVEPKMEVNFPFEPELIISEQVAMEDGPQDGEAVVELKKENEAELTIFLCSECGCQFISVEDCRNHMIKDHSMYPTDESTAKIDSAIINLKPSDPVTDTLSSDEETHLKNIKDIEKFTADILKSHKIKCTVRGCPYRFAKMELLARHTSCHVEGVKNQFRCAECGLVQDSWRLCSLHMWQCHQLDVDFYACPLCDYKGSTANKLKNHVKIHGDERNFVCNDCGRGFKQASQLRNHRVRHMNKEMNDVPRWYTQKRCDICGKIFADSKCLKKHTQAVHSKLKPFICNVCGHTCSRKAMLQMHLRQHTGEKPYSCKICFYKTGDHNSLRRHVMRHSGVRPYKCPHCDYTAIQSNSYKNHLANKHPGMSGSYSCTECPFKTVNDEAFTSHVNDHRNGQIEAMNQEISPNSDIMFSVAADQKDANLYFDTKPIVTIQASHGEKDMDDDETQTCFLSLRDLGDEQTVDTGGITIPAEPADPLSL